MTKKLKVKIQRLSETAIIPQYQTKGSAGFDLHIDEEITIFPKEKVILKTGLAMQIPEGYELQIRPRSGIAAKTGLVICNAPGTIDEDYRGEIKVIMKNTDEFVTHTLHLGDRIAQGILSPILQADFKEVDELEETDRKGGFGSTGLSK